MFEHYIPLLDANNGEPTPKLLDRIIKEHAAIKSRMEKRYEQYKASEQGVAIFSREFDSKEKINNKLNNDFFSEIIDTKVGYLLGVPISYSMENEDDATKDRISSFLNRNNAADKDADVGKFASICGYSARLLYTDLDGLESIANINPAEVVFFTKTSVSEPSYSMRYYTVKVQDGDEFKDNVCIEWYNTVNVITYMGESADKVSETDRKENLFKDVPLIGCENNTEMQGDLDKAISLLEAYDRALSDVNSEIEQFRLAYMMFKGVMIDDETIKMLKQTGALELPEGGDAYFMTKNLDDNIIEHHLDRLERNIMRFTKHVNFTDALGGGTVTGPAMRYKLFMLETKASMLERKMTAFLRQQFKLLFNAWNTRTNGQNSYLDMSFQFTRNVPVNLLEAAQTSQTLKGQVSEETRLSLLPFVDDPNEELQKMQEEQSSIIDLYQTTGGETNAAGSGVDATTTRETGQEDGTSDSTTVQTSAE